MIASEIKSSFTAKYKNEPLLIKSPGRVNLIGEHTDYNLGFVLPAAIEKAIYFAIQKNKSNTIHIETFITSPEQITFDLKGNHKAYDSFWGNYFKAILAILVEKNQELKGFDCVFGGDIPIGSGLSSSAALCCGFIYAVTKVLALNIAKEEIALIAQQAEHKVGLNCGLMDQYAVLFGKKSNALFLDCKDLSHKYVPIHLNGYSWILINSNIKHNLVVDTAYNQRRISCEHIVNQVSTFRENINSLRDISMEDLLAIKKQVSQTDYNRAYYILQENQRVLKMIEALKKGEAKAVGAILLEGHWAMSKQFEITTKEIDYLVKLGQGLAGVLGSRMMGGGFGGCTINLVKTEEIESSVNYIINSYKAHTGIDAEVYHVEISNGVQLMK